MKGKNSMKLWRYGEIGKIIDTAFLIVIMYKYTKQDAKTGQ